MAGNNGQTNREKAAAESHKAAEDEKVVDEKMKKLLAEFLEENKVARVVWNDGTDHLKFRENVTVIAAHGSHILIFEENEYTMVRWGQVIEITFKPSERLVMAAMMGQRMQEKFLDSIAHPKKGDGREFQ
jgi:hypothetical protein